jgi:hypothetical protein
MMPKMANYKIEQLEDGYQPQPFDVICTRHKDSTAHPGNIRFRLCVDMRLDRYMAAKTRREKTKIVKEIIDAVRASGGRFIKPQELNSDDSSGGADTLSSGVASKQREGSMRRVYVDIGNRKAADKISYALRLAAQAREPKPKRRCQSWSAGGSIQTQNDFNHVWPQESFSILGGIPGGAPLLPDRERNSTVKEATFADGEANVISGCADPPVILSWQTLHRRQSWHAGDWLDNEKFARADELQCSTPSSDGSLSSKGWNLSAFQDDDGKIDEDGCSFGSLPSETKKLNLQGANVKQVAEIIDERRKTEQHDVDDNASWDDSLF